MGRDTSWLRRLLAQGASGLLLLLAAAPTLAQTVSFSPATLSFSPAGPYSVPRDAAVGSQVASALAAATATGDPLCVGRDGHGQWHGSLGRDRYLSDQRERYWSQLLCREWLRARP